MFFNEIFRTIALNNLKNVSYQVDLDCGEVEEIKLDQTFFIRSQTCRLSEETVQFIIKLKFILSFLR